MDFSGLFADTERKTEIADGHVQDLQKRQEKGQSNIIMMQSYYDKLVTTDGVFAFDLYTNQMIKISEARPNYTCVADKLQPDHRNENPVSETSLATVTRADATAAHVDWAGQGPGGE